MRRISEDGQDGFKIASLGLSDAVIASLARLAIVVLCVTISLRMTDD
jgi:hypothetical protein